MDLAKIAFASYRRHRICNPYSLDQLARVLSFAELKPGDKGVDLGCGNAYVAAWMAETYGLDLTGVEKFPPLADLARAAAAQSLGQGRLTIVEASGADYLATAGEHRLVCVIGAADLVPGMRHPAQVIAALVHKVEPGGWLLWGDPFWKSPPSARLAAMFGADRYETLAGWVAAGEAAGLVARHTAVSTDADWEEFFWRMNDSLEDWAVENPDDADAVTVKLRAGLLRSVYLEEQREGMGFALYLFQRPG